MRIQKAAFKLKLSEFTIYRSNVFLNFFFGCVPLLVQIFLWKAIYGNGLERIGGYSYKQMITYYVLTFLCSEILDARDNTVKMSEMIQDGQIHNYLLKPIGFLSLNYKLYQAEKMIYLLNVGIPFLVFCLAIHKFIYWKAYNLLFFVISFCLAFVLKYMIGCILGLITTWVEEITGLLDLLNNVEKFLSGSLIPLTLLPSGLNMALSFLPFKYTLFVPVDIYMGNVKSQDMGISIGIQAVWCIVLGVVLIILKNEAFKKYSGYGS